MPESEAVRLIQEGARRAQEIARQKEREAKPLTKTMQSLQERIARQQQLAKEAEVRGELRRSEEWRPKVYQPTPQELLNACRVPSKYRRADSADLAGLPHDVAALYREKLQTLRDLAAGSAIVALLGPRGVGKSWMACALVLEFCRDQKPAMYCDATDFFLELRATYSKEGSRDHLQVEPTYMRPALLVLDECHERGETDFEDRMLTRLINKRYAAEVPTILISNQTKKEFAERIGLSIADRIAESGRAILCEWPSLRGRIGK